MPLYESVFIARQDVSNAQVEALAETFSGIIAAGGGKVSKKEFWGLRNLAYRIKKNRKGHYVLFNLDAPSDAIKEMERNMRINEDVLRYLTVKVEELEEGPSAVMQRRDRDDDEGGRGERRERRFGDRGDRGDRDRGDRGGFGDRDRGDRGDRGDRESRPPRRDDDTAKAGDA